MRVISITLLSLLLGTCSSKPDHLSRIKQLGVLRVITRNSPTTFYLGPHGPAGFEYDLAHLFARELGVKLRIYAPDNFKEILTAVSKGHVDLAAAGLSVTPPRQRRVRFGPYYSSVTQQVVYRYGEKRPANPGDLAGTKLTVVAGSSHEERLETLKQQYPDLSWTADPDVESDELLAEVANGTIDYAIADSNELQLDKRYYPELRAAFALKEPEHLAWAFQRGKDDSLYIAALHFFETIRANGKLEQITERYFGHTDRFDYVGTRIFLHHISTRLPTYRSYFLDASQETGVDWRLLAAIGYQESHWNPRAISPTGVRGIMMLTLNAAGDLGIDNRINPAQSIDGGAKYFASIRSQLDPAILEPDRTWMALAAYNIGLGHLEDARELTVERGGNPNRWIDVRSTLPLLAEKRWYRQTKYGYARGREPVLYVQNIRSYYDILLWVTSQEPRLEKQEKADVVNLGSDTNNKTGGIDSKSP